MLAAIPPNTIEPSVPLQLDGLVPDPAVNVTGVGSVSVTEAIMLEAQPNASTLILE